VRLREGLDLSSTGALRRMASAHGLLHDDATTRGELIDRLAERLLDPNYLQEQLAGLSDDERATLLAARASGGELRGLLVERDHPGSGEALIERGLLFRIFAAAGPLRGEVFEAPQELLAVLPPPPAVEAPPASEGVPAERRASDPAFSLFALASVLGRAGANLEQEVREWSEEPGGWDWEARWTFLRHLGQAAGLLLRQADGTLGPGPALVRLLDDPPSLTARLWRTYLQDRSWSELDHALDPAVERSHPAGVGTRGHALTAGDRGQELADPLLLRKALVDAVQALPPGGWIALDTFGAWLKTARPVFVREQLNARGIVLMDSATWADLEQPLLRVTLLGPLYWLGVIGASPDGLHVVRRPGMLADQAGPLPSGLRAGDLFTEESALGAVRTTPSAPLRAAPPPGRAGAPRLDAEPCRWEGPAELVAPTRASLGTLLDAERYLVLRQRGRPSRYHLVQSHVAAALGSGGSTAECRRLLRKLTQGPLPEAVEDRLAAWERRFGALGVRPAVVLEAHTETELDAAIADEHVRPFVRARLGPTAAEVAAADVLQLAAALRDSGHLPRVDAALRLAAEPRRAYAGLIDEQVLEFLLVCLFAFQQVRPEQLGELEGSSGLLERLEKQFPPGRLSQLRAAAARLSGELGATPPPRPKATPKRRRRRP